MHRLSNKLFFLYIYNLPPPPIKNYKYAFVQYLIILDISACHPAKYKFGAGYPRSKKDLAPNIILHFWCTILVDLTVCTM